MSKAISVENLSKAYRLGAISSRTLAGDINRWWARVRGLPDPLLAIDEKDYGNRDGETVWALKNINFDIQQGEAVGIIGRNGAGKSTLLKILSRVTAPTSGVIKAKGRVASLLEVGTGFHPELTGRENIFMNGAILGMSRKEIQSKFDEIVDFSGVEKYIDTPVKRYSSGMYVRLAFAVAAHLDPDILIVDEVLAVGDAEFQKKCLGKMENVSGKGRTVLFVSHNMQSIEKLCSSAILLHQGKVQLISDEVKDVVDKYLQNSYEHETYTVWQNQGDEYENVWFKPLRFFISDENGMPLQYPIRNNQDVWIRLEGRIQQLHPNLYLGYYLYDHRDNLIFTSWTIDQAENQWPIYKEGNVTLITKFPKRTLNEGTYRIALSARIRNQTTKEFIIHHERDKISINLTIQGGLSDSPVWIKKRKGILAPVMKWDVL